MSTATELVHQAAEALKHANSHSSRMACWIARAALEAAVDNLLVAKERSAPDASMRSKLTILQVACGQDDETTALAQYTWTSLSIACHHHAFELTPTATEVDHLLQLVATVVKIAP